VSNSDARKFGVRFEFIAAIECGEDGFRALALAGRRRGFLRRRPDEASLQSLCRQ